MSPISHDGANQTSSSPLPPPSLCQMDAHHYMARRNPLLAMVATGEPASSTSSATRYSSTPLHCGPALKNTSEISKQTPQKKRLIRVWTGDGRRLAVLVFDRPQGGGVRELQKPHGNSIFTKGFQIKPLFKKTDRGDPPLGGGSDLKQKPAPYFKIQKFAPNKFTKNSPFWHHNF